MPPNNSWKSCIGFVIFPWINFVVGKSCVCLTILFRRREFKDVCDYFSLPRVILRGYISGVKSSWCIKPLYFFQWVDSSLSTRLWSKNKLEIKLPPKMPMVAEYWGKQRKAEWFICNCPLPPWVKLLCYYAGKSFVCVFFKANLLKSCLLNVCFFSNKWINRHFLIIE